MSCEKCEASQDTFDATKVAYYRWKNANIAMIGCDEHLRQVFDALGKAQMVKVLAEANMQDLEKP